eukprot:CAMPEP_0182569664 /NCGR_PEP_ID=MMETSP1324-20130603/10225_1 /TAXON_ID=236786 /ORGANISM="Florenciella sp., Strain RCC1587" /LENGTH=688 /DNA_ID=CAMNT_0024783967 /DNA_START=44 /DNA_END=2110 /DNA_ORIENTATION=-
MAEFEEPEDIDELRDFMEEYDEPINMPPMEQGFSSAIVVDNLPKVDAAKLPKLENVLKKIYSQVGEIKRIKMPMGEKVSLGFAFVEFGSQKMAEQAQKRTNGYKLDKTHIFDVVLYNELSRLLDVPDDYVEPPEPPLKRSVDNMSWLSDATGRDQFVLRFDLETVVNWCDSSVGPVVEYDGAREKAGGKHWCELYVQWSPRGSYLTTFHRPGIALWGGAEFGKQARLAHAEVKSVAFSPCERYLLTCNFRQGDPAAIIIWDVREARALRSFELTFNALTGQPIQFQWSYDGQYIARMAKDKAGGDVIQIYELPTMNLLEKKSLRAQGVRDFLWSPKDNTLAYWAPEIENTPAGVKLVSIPSRETIREKNLFNVHECRLSWQSDGDYLSVKVTRHTKSKKTQYNNFELFRMRDNLIPVEMLDIKDRVQAMAWEPGGDRFAVVHGDGGTPSVSFYTMKGTPPGAKPGSKQELLLLKTLEQRQCSHLYWSPSGGHIVLSGQGDYNGALEFYDVDALLEKGVTSDHYRCNYVEWDPSGRIVATAVTQPFDGAFYKFQMDNGYKLHTFQGEDFFEKQTEKFYQFMWRPRPPSLLDADAKKKVIKNLRKYERKFERADKEKAKRRHLLSMRTQWDLRDEHRQLLADRKAEFDALKAERVRLRDGFDEDDDSNYVITETYLEEVLDEKEIIIHSL